MRIARYLTRSYMVVIITIVVCALLHIIHIDRTQTVLFTLGVLCWVLVETMGSRRADNPPR